MARPRKPERDEAKKLYLKSGGKISAKELAAAVGVDDGRIRKWKSLDKWEDALQKQPKKKGGQPGNKNAAGSTPAKQGNKNAVTHGAFAHVGIEDLTEEQQEEILAMKPGETLQRMNEELQGLLVRKTYLTNLLNGFTDPQKQQEYYTDKIVHMVVPIPQEDRAQAEEMGMELELAADPEGGKESLKTAMKTIIKASPFDRAMKVEAELNKLNGRIIKLLDSMRAHEADQSRLALERLKYQLARQKATGEFDIDPEDGADVEEDPEDVEPGGAE